MPVSLLYVEGNLDAELLGPLCAGAPAVRAAKASKNALAPIVRRERDGGNEFAYYVRDRDFDFEPPGDLSRPVVDRQDTARNRVLGWHWCRHEIESYLVDPALVVAALDIETTSYEAALFEAGRSIVHYEAARWAVGTARRSLPPNYKLNTRPEDAENVEFHLPADMSREACHDWALTHASVFGDRVGEALAEESVESTFLQAEARFDSVAQDTAGLLLWFAGKDLLKAMEPWFVDQGFANPSTFRTRVRDWVTSHPEETLNLLPEWRFFVEMLRE